MHIIDRRRDPGGKSLANRQRFIRRARAQVRRAVREASSKRSIKEMGEGGEVTVPADGVHEPTFRPGPYGGHREYVLPGNKKFVSGDRIDRPDESGGGSGASDSGEGEDDYNFVLSREEFLELFLEDLELPDMAKRQVMGVEEQIPRRAGYRSYGSPSALSVSRTMRNSLSRRIALRRPSQDEIRRMEEGVAELDLVADPEPVPFISVEIGEMERSFRPLGDGLVQPFRLAFVHHTLPRAKPLAM